MQILLKACQIRKKLFFIFICLLYLSQCQLFLECSIVSLTFNINFLFLLLYPNKFYLISSVLISSYFVQQNKKISNSARKIYISGCVIYLLLYIHLSLVVYILFSPSCHINSTLCLLNVGTAVNLPVLNFVLSVLQGYLGVSLNLSLLNIYSI